MRLALQEGTTVDHLDPLAWKEDWALQDVVQASGDQPYQSVWSTDEGVEIRFVDDPMIGLPYLILTGDGVAPVAAALQGLLPIIDAAAVLRLEGDASDLRERVYAVLYAGIATGPHTPPDVLAVIERAARSPEADVRQAAVIAASYARRRELRPAVQALLADPDADVREEAANVSAMLERTWNAEA